MTKLVLKNFLLAGAVFCSAQTALAAGPAATIADLDWMTGNYAGALGPNQLEENWIKAEGGSIAAMVRSTGNGGTSMFEMITIEEVDGSLVLHIQQFDPGFKARTAAPQKMELGMIGPNHVHFEAVTEGSMKTLGYTKDGDTFIIHVGRPDGGKVDLPLQVRSIWE